MADFDYAQFSAEFPWFFPTAAFMIGACVGSFLNVVIYRVPKEESVVTPGSHCGCGAPIKWHDNIPILSWLILRGRARCCGRSFSFRYPFVELLTAALFLVCWLSFPPLVALSGWIFISCLIAATFIDLDHFIIPDAFTLWLGLVGLAVSLAVPALHGQQSGDPMRDALCSGMLSLAGSLVGSALVLWISVLAEAVLRKQAMGFGDVKFVGAIGAFCGWQGAVFAVFGGAVVGTVWFLVAWTWQRVTGKRAPLTPPVEKPTEEDQAPEFSWRDAFALGAAILAIVASFALPVLHGHRGDYFLIDSLRSTGEAARGLLIGSGLVLWLGLFVEKIVRKEFLPFYVVQLAGAVGALTPWPLTALGVARGVALTAVAGGIGCGVWLLARRLQRARPAGTSTEAAAPDEQPDEAPALGFGMHVPFGPMLAIAGALYFLFFREWVTAWFQEVAVLF